MMMSDESIELPEGWETANLDDVVEILDNKRIPLNADERAKRKGEYVYYGANGKVDTIDSYLFDGSHVLIAEDGGYFDNPLKDVAYEATGKFWVNNHAHVVKGLNGIESQFLVYVLNQIDWMRYVSGTTRLKLTQAALKQIALPIPPIAEQKRIVAKIEELRSRTQKAREALEAIPKMCDRFRQSVLAAAFRGDLTADWREENPNVEPAQVLLEKIRQELSKQKGKKVDDKLPDPFNIADSWKWVSLSEICYSITDGDHQPPPKSETGIPFLTISNISSGKFDFNNIRYVSESYYEKIQEHRKAKKGDILYSVVGSYGIPVLVDFEDRFCFQRHIAILKLHSLIESKYLLYVLKADFVFKQATEVATGTTQLTVTLSGLRRIRVPLVPRVEQELIIERLEKVLSGIDRIQQQYEQAKARLDKLDRAILAKAFRGELVPQDPNDEPASVLLDRIREERAKKSDRKLTKRKR